MKPTVIDLFCGAGGLSLGFSFAGFVPLIGIDKIKDCTDTYSHNFPDACVINKDVRDIVKGEVKRIIKKQFGVKSVDVVMGGPPCESFSTAGPGIRTKTIGDFRDTLAWHVVCIANELDAKYLLIENIPGFTTKKDRSGVPGGVFMAILRAMELQGFKNYKISTLDAVNFGVPQFRKRLFILATRDSSLPLRFPDPTHTAPSSTEVSKKQKHKWITTEDAISDLPSLQSYQHGSERKDHYQHPPKNNYQKLMTGTPSDEFPIPHSYLKHAMRDWDGLKVSYHWAPNHRPRTIERLKLIKHGEGLRDLWKRLPKKKRKKLQKAKIIPKRWYIQRFRKLVSSQPSFTVTTHCLDELASPSDTRMITIREAARLQSFPDWFEFTGGKWVNPHGFEPQDKYEQVGDAVPPLLAQRIAGEMRKSL